MTARDIETDSRPWDCEHHEVALRWRTYPTGGAWVDQCQRCGRHMQSVKKNDPRVLSLSERIPYDEELAERWRQEKMLEWQAIYSEQRAAQKARWWVDYDQYLLSAAWEQRRARVLGRDNLVCQACLSARATQVHHLAYQHLGNEPLFDSVAVCKPCHDTITAMDRAHNT